MISRAASRLSSDTAAQIRQVALELFSEYGFDGTALQQIADRLGFTKAALYYHYKSKDDLLIDVVEPLFADLDAVMDAAESAEGRKPANRRKRLEDYVDCLIAHRDVLGFLFHDLAVLGNPAVARRSRALQDRISATIAGTDLSLKNRIRISFAFSGMQGAIVTHADATPAQLREPILDSINAIRRAVMRETADASGASGATGADPADA